MVVIADLLDFKSKINFEEFKKQVKTPIIINSHFEFTLTGKDGRKVTHNLIKDKEMLALSGILRRLRPFDYNNSILKETPPFIPQVNYFVSAN